MKTSTKIFTGIAVVAIALSTTAGVFADSGNGSAPDQILGQGRGASSEQDGLLDDYMTATMADVFGLDVEELEAFLAADETFITIALSQGYTIEDVDGLMDEVRSSAIELAAADGIFLGSQEAGQMANQFGARGQGVGYSGQAGMARYSMTGSSLNMQDCDCGGVALNADTAGEAMMRRGNR